MVPPTFSLPGVAHSRICKPGNDGILRVENPLSRLQVSTDTGSTHCQDPHGPCAAVSSYMNGWTGSMIADILAGARGEQVIHDPWPMSFVEPAVLQSSSSDLANHKIVVREQQE